MKQKVGPMQLIRWFAHRPRPTLPYLGLTGGTLPAISMSLTLLNSVQWSYGYWRTWNGRWWIISCDACSWSSLLAAHNTVDHCQSMQTTVRSYKQSGLQYLRLLLNRSWKRRVGSDDATCVGRTRVRHMPAYVMYMSHCSSAAQYTDHTRDQCKQVQDCMLG